MTQQEIQQVFELMASDDPTNKMVAWNLVDFEDEIFFRSSANDVAEFFQDFFGKFLDPFYIEIVEVDFDEDENGYYKTAYRLYVTHKAWKEQKLCMKFDYQGALLQKIKHKPDSILHYILNKILWYSVGQIAKEYNLSEGQ
ncbi:MAG: hypothetical protein ACFB0B_15420 [Thermonemataceae bacterium]